MKSFNEMCNELLPDIWRPHWKEKLYDVFGKENIDKLNSKQIDELIKCYPEED